MKLKLPILTILLAALYPATMHATTLVAGWDAFDTVTSPTATQLSTDTTASMATSGTGGNWDDWNNNSLGASPDGTFGSLSSAIAAASTDVGTGSNQGTNLSLNRSRKPGTITITLTNNSTEDRLMGGFYFDAVGRFSQSAKDWTLTFGGAISGTAASGTLTQTDMIAATPAQRDWEVNLATLTDSVWEAGTDAIFTLTFSGGDTSTGTGGGQETLVDNIGITVIPPPPEIVKDDNAIDLSNDLSWVLGTAPASGEIAVWDSTVTSANTTVLGADVTWGGIKITSPTGLVTVNSGNTLTLDGLTTAIDLSSATEDLTLDCNLALSGSSAMDVATGRTLSLGGVVSGASGLTKAGDGTAIISGNNTYTNGTFVDAGVLQLGASNVIPDTTDSGDVSVTGTLDLNGNSDTIWALTGSGTVDNTADSTTSTLVVGDFGKSGTFSGTLQNSGTSAILNLEKIGNGTVVLSGANTYSGTTTVSGGSLEIESLGALSGTSEIVLADGAEFIPDLDGLTVSAPITLDTTGTTSLISVPINGPGSGGDITMTLNGVISGDGNLIFSDLSGFGNNSDGIIVLGAASTYTGTTTIATGALIGNNTIIRSGVANALPTTTVLSLEGIKWTGSGRKVTFDLDGNDQTLAGLQNVPQFDRQQRVTSSGAATLTINNADDFTFGVGGGGDGYAQIQGAISIVKSAAGTFTLSETQPYTGTTSVNAGTLGLDGASLASDVTVAGGASLEFTLDSPSSTSGSLDLGTGTLKIVGAVDNASDYQLMTATGGISGTPTLDAAISDYELELRNGDTELWLAFAPAGYASWAALNGAGVDLEGDHDDDGVKNGVEFFIGGPDGNTTGQTTLPAVVDNAGTLSITWTKSADYTGVYGTDYRVETSATLSAPWTPQAAEPDSGFTVTVTTTEVKFTFPAGTKDFARLVVTGP